MRILAKKTSLRSALIVVEVSCLALTAVFMGFDSGSAALVFVAAALACMFFRVRAAYSEIEWSLHPLRLVIPLLVVFQMVYWIWFGLLGEIRPVTDWDWMLSQIDRRSMGGLLAVYLFGHVPLLIGLDLGFRAIRRRWRPSDTKVSMVKPMAILLVGFLGLTVATLGDAGLLSGNSIFAYLNTSIDRVFMTLYGLLVLIAVLPSTRISHKIAAFAVLAVGLAVGIMLSIKIGMRYVVFQQILVFVAVFWTAGQLYGGRAISAKLVLFLVLSIPLFGVLTASKFSSSGDVSDSGSVASNLQFVTERGLQRLAPFTTDALIAENQAEESLFTSFDSSLIRLASAIPLLNTAFSFKERDEESLENRIYSYTSRYWESADGVSVFISGTSESIYAFGTALGIVIIFLAGLLHGVAVSISSRICGHLNWVNVTSQYVLFALLGMNISDFIRLPVNILLGAVLCYFLIQRQPYRRVNPS